MSGRRWVGSAGGLAAVAGWGAAEALWWPILPDVAIVLGAVTSPEQRWRLAGAGLAGSVAGGLVAYGLGARGLVPSMPLVTPRMVAAVDDWLGGGNAPGVWRQPLSGVPFKVFAYGAGPAGVTGPAFLAHSAAARGARLLAVAALSGLGGRLLDAVVPARHRALASALSGAVVLVTSGVGLARVVRHWS